MGGSSPVNRYKKWLSGCHPILSSHRASLPIDPSSYYWNSPALRTMKCWWRSKLIVRTLRHLLLSFLPLGNCTPQGRVGVTSPTSASSSKMHPRSALHSFVMVPRKHSHNLLVSSYNFEAFMVSWGHETVLGDPRPSKEQITKSSIIDNMKASNCSDTLTNILTLMHPCVKYASPPKLDIPISYLTICSREIPTASNIENGIMFREDLDPPILVLVPHHMSRGNDVKRCVWYSSDICLSSVLKTTVAPSYLVILCNFS